MNYYESLSYIHSIPKFRRPLGNVQLARLLHAAGVRCVRYQRTGRRIEIEL